LASCTASGAPKGVEGEAPPSGPGIFDRPGQPGVEFCAIPALAGRAAPPQGCSANLEAV